MAGVLTLLLVVFVMFYILSSITKSKSARKNNKPRNRIKKIDFTQVKLPMGLDFRPEMQLQELEQRLEQGLSASFLEQLKQRVMGAHSHLSSAEYEWKLLELKRYLAMNVILRQAPMFSEAVDEIWHEMIMFTRDYQQLCVQLTGAMIHHTPHVIKLSLPDERAWFDWIYGHLFEFTPFSDLIWNPFYKFPLSRERIQQLKELNEKEIMERLFNAQTAEIFPEVKAAVQSLIQQAQAQIDAVDDPQYSFNRRSGMQPMDVMGYAAGAMIFYSLMDNGSYVDNMQAILPEEIQRRNDGAGGSSCGTGDNGVSSCSSDGGSGGGSDGSGSSSGCSSSSCGSGCGGGGD